MDFKQLESFVAVVDEGSFSNAAERMQLSQSMVTIHIRNLENELGTRLLNRTTRSMELTGDGRTFYYYAKQILKLNRDSMFALTRANQDEKAAALIRSLPHIWESREILMPEVFEGEAYTEELRKCIVKVCSFLCQKIDAVSNRNLGDTPDYIQLGVDFTPTQSIDDMLGQIKAFLEP